MWLHWQFLQGRQSRWKQLAHLAKQGKLELSLAQLSPSLFVYLSFHDSNKFMHIVIATLSFNNCIWTKFHFHISSLGLTYLLFVKCFCPFSKYIYLMVSGHTLYLPSPTIFLLNHPSISCTYFWFKYFRTNIRGGVRIWAKPASVIIEY